MPEAFMSYVVENDKAFQKAVTDALRRVSDLRIPFNLIMRDFYRSEQAIFALKGPGQYPPFKNSGGSYRRNSHGERVFVADKDPRMSRYQRAKLKAVGFDYPLLVRTGRLAASMLSPSAPGAIAQITAVSLTIGTTVAYGIYHQSSAPRKIIPLRKFLFIGPEAVKFASSDQVGRPQRWLGYIRDYVMKKGALG